MSKYGIILGQDEQTIEDLQRTTEQQAPNGYTVRYIPPAANQEHRTDSLRAFAATLIRMGDMSEPDEDWLQHVHIITPEQPYYDSPTGLYPRIY